jgi:hypothetical protein
MLGKRRLDWLGSGSWQNGGGISSEAGRNERLVVCLFYFGVRSFGRSELGVVMEMEMEMAFQQCVKYFSEAPLGSRNCELEVWACSVGIDNVIRMDMIRMIMIIRKRPFFDVFLGT